MIGAVAFRRVLTSLGVFRMRARRASFKGLVAAVVALAVLASSTVPAFAAGGTIGAITGTVVDANGAAVAGAAVALAGPSGKYSAKTDGSGRFSIAGMAVDTYNLSITSPGKQPYVNPAVTVVGDQIVNLGSLTLSTGQLALIGHAAAVKKSNLFQPLQTVDSYTINQDQIVQSTGKPDSTNENAALVSVPGVTYTDNNTPYSTQVTIRGGAETEVGYQLDGVPFRDPYVNGNGSYGLMNGVGNVQVVEGAADATQAGVGAGVINVVPTRGSGPGTATVDLETGGPNRNNQYGASYGFATPDYRISEYFSYIGQNYQPFNGYGFTNQAAYGNYFATDTVKNDQIVNNFFFKFGKDNNQQIQVLYTNVSQQGWQGVTGAGGVYNQVTNPYALVYYPWDTLTQPFPCLGLCSPAQYASLVGLAPGTPSTLGPIPGPQQNFSNQTRFLKIEYDYNLSSNTFLGLRYYNWDALQSQDDSYSLGLTTGAFTVPETSTQGGQTTGVNLDIIHNLTPNFTVSLNGQFNVLEPVSDDDFPTYEPLLLGLTEGLAGYPQLTDWAPGGEVYNAYCGATPYSGAGPLPACDPRLPSLDLGYNGSIFQNFGYGIRFQYSPGTKLKFDLGVRWEGQNQKWQSQLTNLGQGVPATGTCQSVVYCGAVGATVPITNLYDVPPSFFSAQVISPKVIEPRDSISYQFDDDDSLRLSYGRSAVFSDAFSGGRPLQLSNLQLYTKLPAQAGSVCGIYFTVTFPCQSYGAELYWLNDNFFDAPDTSSGEPALYNNYDASFNHLFANGMAMRITPFFKNGTNLPFFSVVTNTVAGQSESLYQIANLGLNKTTGVELDLSTAQHAQGLSGFFAATYTNVLSSLVPGTEGQDTLPRASPASLALSDVYRAGYISPGTLRIGGTLAFKNGFSINAQLEANVGYPYSVGNTVAGLLANGTPANVTQVDFGPGIATNNGSLIGYSPGTAGSTNYYDPAYSGSALNPNIAATRGTPATSSDGGILSHYNLQGAITFQYKWSRSTIGLQFQNVFGNGYVNTVPSVNPWYQPVANGIAGPQTGYESCANTVGAGLRGCSPFVPLDAYAFANGAYLLTNGNYSSNSTLGVPVLGPEAPMSVQLYYQLKL